MLTREFELPGAGPAAWMRLTPSRPDLVTLLVLRPVLQAGVVVSLEVEGSAGTEPIAERVFTDVAKSWVAGSTQGFSTGSGAFVMEPSQNERASQSFVAPGVELSIQTETVEEPDDGQSSTEPPPGGNILLKQRRASAASRASINARGCPTKARANASPTSGSFRVSRPMAPHHAFAWRRAARSRARARSTRPGTRCWRRGACVR